MRRVPVGLVVGVLLLAVGAEASAHARLVRSDPASGSVLGQSPARLTLRFNSLVEQRFARFWLVTSASSRSLTASPQKGRTVRTLHVPLPKLSPGAYRVDWSVVARDSHRVEGAIPFTVR